jgi:amidase
MNDDICFMTACELAQRIRRRELSAVEVMRAHLTQIERVNPMVNAIVTLTAEQALAEARKADEALAQDIAPGPLHGLPVAHKDLVDTRGIRTTYGSPIYANHVPEEDALIVTRLRRAGAITLGKTNTPEFGAGSQTFNPVFGPTLNPYDPTKTCGGSSGGAAVALACGMVPIADGSDMGGSLRNPAAFCNVVGFRPSPGRVSAWPVSNAWDPLSVEGPMARTVADVALMLSVMAGFDPRAPLSIDERGDVFMRPLERDFRSVRVAWLGESEIDGVPFDRRICKVVNGCRSSFEAMGCVVEDAAFDWSDADFVFKTLRARAFITNLQWEYRHHKARLKDTIVWNYEQGAQLTMEQIADAELKRTQLFHRAHQFMQTYEFFVLPVTQVPPFDVTQPFVTEIEGVEMNSYIDWMRSCYFVSVLGHPAISVPCGFTPEGLPVGLQIVGRYRDDFGVLQIAHAFEQATQFWRRRPPVAFQKLSGAPSDWRL